MLVSGRLALAAHGGFELDVGGPEETELAATDKALGDLHLAVTEPAVPEEETAEAKLVVDGCDSVASEAAGPSQLAVAPRGASCARHGQPAASCMLRLTRNSGYAQPWHTGTQVARVCPGASRRCSPGMPPVAVAGRVRLPRALGAAATAPPGKPRRGVGHVCGGAARRGPASAARWHGAPRRPRLAWQARKRAVTQRLSAAESTPAARAGPREQDSAAAAGRAPAA